MKFKMIPHTERNPSSYHISFLPLFINFRTCSFQTHNITQESQISPIRDIKRASPQPDLTSSVKLGGVVKCGALFFLDGQYYLVSYVTTGQQYKLTTI